MNLLAIKRFACDGIEEILWHGKIDFHSIIPSTTSLGYMRIGTSVQSNEGLVQRIKLLIMMQKYGKDITKKVRGVTKIEESKLQNVK